MKKLSLGLTAFLQAMALTIYCSLVGVFSGMLTAGFQP